MEQLKKIIAKNIQMLRQASAMTQADLAASLNYSDKAVSKWERGESVPDVHILKQIADIFEVTVDYLLSESHDDKTELPKVSKKIIKRNHLVITMLATTVIWLLATIAFVIGGLIQNSFDKVWLSYIVAIPLSCVVLLVFNSIWGKSKLNYPIISLLMWSILLALCLFLQIEKIWIIFVVGIPGQIMILLASGFKIKKR